MRHEVAILLGLGLLCVLCTWERTKPKQIQSSSIDISSGPTERVVEHHPSLASSVRTVRRSEFMNGYVNYSNVESTTNETAETLPTFVSSETNVSLDNNNLTSSLGFPVAEELSTPTQKEEAVDEDMETNSNEIEQDPIISQGSSPPLVIFPNSSPNHMASSHSVETVNLNYENTRKNNSQLTNSTDEDVDYVSMGEQLLSDATTILDTGIWNFQRETEDGDQIFSRQLNNGNMVYRLTGVVNMPAENLLVIIYDGLGDYAKWNPSFIECRVLEKINDDTDISYTVSASGARGYVASRDFVSLRHWVLRDKTYIAASKSIDFPGAPSNPDYIRGLNGPGCMELRPLSSDPDKTEFRWLLNTKLNGWIPSYIADKAYKRFMTKYMVFLREYCKKIKMRVSDSSTIP
uniref:START domain-containing protein n=1 Tax=Homalodisca liturata TaxID=320908 RepID=A0A1B6JLK7_9HEMI